MTEGIRFRWKESGFVGRNQVSLEGIRFRWKESGFVGRNQVSLERIRFCRLGCKYGMRVWRDRICGSGCVHSCVRLGCIMERVIEGDDGRVCCIQGLWFTGG